MSCKTCKDKKLSDQISDTDHKEVLKLANFYVKTISFLVLLLLTPLIFLFVTFNLFSVMFFNRDIDFTGMIVNFIKLFEKKKEFRGDNKDNQKKVVIEETEPNTDYISFDEIVSETKR